MRYHIDTIPLWDAFREGGECPLCTIARKLEVDRIQAHIGGGAMDPDIRVATNEQGFCTRHFTLLVETEQRLPLALVTHTHLKETVCRLKASMKALEDAPASSKMKRREPESCVNQLLSLLTAHEHSCIICANVHNTMLRYAETVLIMWHKEPEFAEAFAQNKGFCLPHFKLLVNAAGQHLRGEEQSRFLSLLCMQQRTAMERLDQELGWFIQKFDHVNTASPWGTSRDALPRTLHKLKGPFMK